MLGMHTFLPGRMVTSYARAPLAGFEYALGKLWNGGYAACSTEETILSDEGKVKAFKEILRGGSIETSGLFANPEGPLMEVGLWREDNNLYEEISMEREDGNFIFQRWTLHTNDEHDGRLCYWRKTNFKIQKHLNLLGNDINVIEVIIPETRMHIFLTTAIY
ncbi:hypothetical protein M7784_07530 [Desulfovibrio aminophilus]|jgi:hypothetical protein|nr:hypothetical protein [Desulfovibrio aminophilus]MCM0755098.1 hypothetical protein [Desulfovibrio aminophilus]